MARTVDCVKLGRKADGLDHPPLPGELGRRLYENVSKDAWQNWIRLQTMIINENRLKLVDPDARQYLSEQVIKHFFGDGVDTALSGCVPPVVARVPWSRSGLD